MTKYDSDGREMIEVPISPGVATLVISAGTNSVSFGTVSFADSNGVTFGMSGSTITASMSGGGGGGIAASLSGNTTGTLTPVSSGTLILAGGNNITLSQNGQSVTISGPNAGGAQTGISSIIVSNTTFTSGAVSFSNGNGASFGSSGTGQAITISYTVPSTTGLISAINLTAGTTNTNASNFSFANSNGLAFGLSGLTITGSYTVPTQTVQTQNAVDVTISGNVAGVPALVSSGTLTLAGGNNITLSQVGNAITISGPNAGGVQTGISGIANSQTTYTSGTVSFSELGAITIRSTTGNQFQFSVNAQSNVAFSADVSSTFQTLTFQNSNGVSFSNNGGAIRVTHALQFTSNTSAITSNAVNTSASRVINIVAATDTTGGGTASLSSNVSFSNANGATFYTSAGNAIALSYTVPSTVAQTAQTLGVYLTGNTFGAATSTTMDARSLSVSGIELAFVAFSNGMLVVDASPLVQVSAGTDSTRLIPGITLSNSNNVSFGFLTGPTLTRRITASYEFDISAGASTNGVNGVTFSDANGVFWGYDGTNVTANAGYLSYYENLPWLVATGTQTHGNSTAGIVPFKLQAPGSFSYLRVPNSFSTNSTTQVGTSNTSIGFTASALSTFFAVVYSMGTGANSRSLQFVASGSAGFSQQISMTLSGTRYSVTQKYTFPQEGATNLTASFSTAISNTNLAVNSEAANSDFNGFRHLDIPFANSLSAGAYWLAYGRSSTTSTQSLSFATGGRIDHSNQCGTQANNVWGLLGAATASSNQLQQGIGSYTTNAMTTSSIALSQISSSASHMHPYFQLIRQA